MNSSNSIYKKKYISRELILKYKIRNKLSFCYLCWGTENDTIMHVLLIVITFIIDFLFVCTIML